jgi:hypothetical protein
MKMKNGSGKNSAAKPMKSLFLPSSADAARPPDVDFCRKTMFFCSQNFLGPF